MASSGAPARFSSTTGTIARTTASPSTAGVTASPRTPPRASAGGADHWLAALQRAVAAMPRQLAQFAEPSASARDCAFVEAAHHYRHRPAVGAELARRQHGQDPRVIQIAWRA
jgi:hypothetical protein